MIDRRVLALLLGAVSASAMAQISFGGTGTVQYECALNSSDLLSSGGELIAVLSPLVYVSGETYEMSLKTVASFVREQVSLDIDELYLIISPSDSLSLRIGRFAYLPGAAEYFSNVNYFARVDTTKLLAGSKSGHLVFTELLQIGFYLPNVYLLLTASVVRPEMLLPGTESPWFPMAQFPQTLTVFFPSEHDLVLERIYFEQEDPHVSTLADVSVCAELGATVWGIDASLFYYHGWDSAPLTSAEFRFPSGLYESYEIVLHPVYRPVDAIGLMMATSFQALRLYLDCSVAVNKTLLTKRLSSANLETATAQVPYVAYSLGASYEISEVDLLLLSEITDRIAVDATEELVKPMLSSAIMVGARFSPRRWHLAATMAGIVSLVDRSLVVISELAYRPSEDLEVYVFSPLFSGEAESELGQFRDNVHITAGIRWFF